MNKLIKTFITLMILIQTFNLSTMATELCGTTVCQNGPGKVDWVITQGNFFFIQVHVGSETPVICWFENDAAGNGKAMLSACLTALNNQSTVVPRYQRSSTCSTKLFRGDTSDLTVDVKLISLGMFPQ